MRQISEALRAHLAEDATTLAHGWRITRSDGVALAFTDHDYDLDFAGARFVAASGFEPSADESENGLAATSADVAGALSSNAITEDDIRAGRYDGARVELFLVNWAAPDQHIRLRVLEIGEITRTDSDFRAELRSTAHRLGQAQGRIYSHRCDADFGDHRCGVDAAGWTASGTVGEAADRAAMQVSGLGDYPSGRFRYGLLTFTSGALAGVRTDLESHVIIDGVVTLTFWLPLATAPQPGDAFTVIAGCDKSFATCKSGFGNSLNFRGFPHMPGSDFSYSYADGESVHDGSPLYD